MFESCRRRRRRCLLFSPAAITSTKRVRIIMYARRETIVVRVLKWPGENRELNHEDRPRKAENSAQSPTCSVHLRRNNTDDMRYSCQHCDVLNALKSYTRKRCRRRHERIFRRLIVIVYILLYDGRRTTRGYCLRFPSARAFVWFSWSFFFQSQFLLRARTLLFHFYARSQAKLFNRTIVNSHAHIHTAGLSRLWLVKCIIVCSHDLERTAVVVKTMATYLYMATCSSRAIEKRSSKWNCRLNYVICTYTIGICIRVNIL